MPPTTRNRDTARLANAWGPVIKRQREALNMLQADLAAKLNTTQGTVSRWENCDFAPSAHHQARLVRVLGIPPDELWRLTQLAGEVPS